MLVVVKFFLIYMGLVIFHESWWKFENIMYKLALLLLVVTTTVERRKIYRE